MFVHIRPLRIGISLVVLIERSNDISFGLVSFNGSECGELLLIDFDRNVFHKPIENNHTVNRYTAGDCT